VTGLRDFRYFRYLYVGIFRASPEVEVSGSAATRAAVLTSNGDRRRFVQLTAQAAGVTGVTQLKAIVDGLGIQSGTTSGLQEADDALASGLDLIEGDGAASHAAIGEAFIFVVAKELVGGALINETAASFEVAEVEDRFGVAVFP